MKAGALAPFAKLLAQNGSREANGVAFLLCSPVQHCSKWNEFEIPSTSFPAVQRPIYRPRGGGLWIVAEDVMDSSIPFFCSYFHRTARKKRFLVQRQLVSCIKMQNCTPCPVGSVVWWKVCNFCLLCFPPYVLCVSLLCLCNFKNVSSWLIFAERNLITETSGSGCSSSGVVVAAHWCKWNIRIRWGKTCHGFALKTQPSKLMFRGILHKRKTK